MNFPCESKQRIDICDRISVAVATQIGKHELVKLRCGETDNISFKLLTRIGHEDGACYWMNVDDDGHHRLLGAYHHIVLRERCRTFKDVVKSVS